jgi:2-polyprenyl-3-methyl-5-hydroxy-6-metoxy-1,4-benzoquinol methylase
MANVVDERGYNQIFRPSRAQVIRLERRAAAIVDEMLLPTAPQARNRIRILELGCGMGELAYQLAVLTDAQVTGIDLSTRFVDEARALHKHERLTFIVGDLSRMTPSADFEKYNYIVGNGILHHLYHDLDSFLPVLASWLAPGGRLIFWEPNLINPYVYLIFSFSALRRMAKLEPGEMAFTAGFIIQKLKQAGFSKVEVTPRDFLLPNTPGFLIRLVIATGAVLENIPLLRSVAQSIFLTAQIESQAHSRESR